MNRYACVVASMVLTTSCGFHAPVRSSGPSRSPDGVSITIRGEKCHAGSPTDPAKQETDLELLIEAVNASNEEVQFRPARLRIVSPHGYAERRDASDDEEAWLRSGDRTEIVKRFHGGAGTSCSDSVQIGVASAVLSADGKPVELPAIALVAGR